MIGLIASSMVERLDTTPLVVMEIGTRGWKERLRREQEKDRKNSSDSGKKDSNSGMSIKTIKEALVAIAMEDMTMVVNIMLTLLEFKKSMKRAVIC